MLYNGGSRARTAGVGGLGGAGGPGSLERVKVVHAPRPLADVAAGLLVDLEDRAVVVQVNARLHTVASV